MVKVLFNAGQEQHARWKAAAVAEGLSLSEWLRRAADTRLLSASEVGTGGVGEDPLSLVASPASVPANDLADKLREARELLE